MTNILDYVEVTEKEIHGFNIIKVLQGKFKDVEYVYGAIMVSEEKDEAKLQYEYTILTGSVDDAAEFEKFTGDVLFSMMDSQLDEGKVVYAGGTD